jgi:iron(III) transport system substrate-binding protein
MNRREFNLLGLAAGASFYVGRANAQAGWEEIVKAAGKEGEVQVYSTQAEWVIKRVVEGFMKKYPDISATLTRMPGGPMGTKLDQERASNSDGGDVGISTDLGWFDARGNEGGLIKPVGPSSSDWPAEALKANNMVISGADPFCMVYHKERVQTPPATYMDLLKPELKGKIGMLEVAAGTGPIALYDWIEKTYGMDYFPKLKAHGVRLYASSLPAAQAVASGEIDVSGYGFPSFTVPVIEQGAPIAYSVPNPGLGAPGVMAAFKWSKRPNAAQVFLDYVMSVEGQTLWHGGGTSVSPRPNIPGAIPSASVTSYDAAAYTPEVQAKYREEWTKRFNS